jgi:REP element-mobilizing transposase RayT
MLVLLKKRDLNLLEIYKRHLPHWRLEGAVYYVTFNLYEGMFNQAEIEIVKENIISGDNKFYSLIAVQVMPDHVHCILKSEHGYSLSDIMKGIKGVTARLINKHRNSSGRLWLHESYDRIIRNENELNQKIFYIYSNPVRSELVEDPEEYYGWFINVQ